MKTEQFRTISFLRGISAFYVMLAHILIWGDYTDYFPNPKVAVDVFIFISGFLIFYKLKKNDSSLLAFYLNRFFRIAPAFYFTIFIFTISYVFVKDGLVYIQSLNPSKWPPGGTYDANNIYYDAKNILLHVSFIFGLFPEHSFSSYIGDWSISLEMQFYIIAPMIYIALRGEKIHLYFLAALLTIAFAYYADYNKFSWAYKEPSLLLFKIHIFILGAITLINTSIKDNFKTSAVLAILMIAIIAFQYWIQRNTFTSNNSSIYLALSVTLVLFHRRLSRFFDGMLVNFLSKISYPLFLIHGFFIAMSGLVHKMYFSNQPLLLVMAIITIPCSIATAWVLANTIEKIGINFGKRLEDKVDMKKIDSAFTARRFD